MNLTAEKRKPKRWKTSQRKELASFWISKVQPKVGSWLIWFIQGWMDDGGGGGRRKDIKDHPSDRRAQGQFCGPLNSGLSTPDFVHLHQISIPKRDYVVLVWDTDEETAFIVFSFAAWMVLGKLLLSLILTTLLAMNKPSVRIPNTYPGWVFAMSSNRTDVPSSKLKRFPIRPLSFPTFGIVFLDLPVSNHSFSSFSCLSYFSSESSFLSPSSSVSCELLPKSKLFLSLKTAWALSLHSPTERVPKGVPKIKSKL